MKETLKQHKQEDRNVLANLLYERAKRVLKDVSNAHLLDGPVPLGYLPVPKHLEVDASTESVRLVDRWTIIPTGDKYSKFPPTLAGRLMGEESEGGEEKNGKGKTNFIPPIGHPIYMAALQDLRAWLEQHNPQYVPAIDAVIALIPRLNSLLTEFTKRVGLTEKEARAAMQMRVLFTWDGQRLTDLPEVVQWFRKRYTEAYDRRLKDTGYRAEYQNGAIRLYYGDSPVEASSILSGQRISDPCIYMMPYLDGNQSKQLISFDKSSYQSYSRLSNLNAPMGLEETWWIAACASRIFNDSWYTKRLGKTCKGSAALTHLEELQDSVVRDAELDALIEELLGIPANEVSDEDESTGGKQARAVAADEAARFYKSSSSSLQANPDARVTVILREEVQGRSCIRYISTVSLAEAVERFRTLKQALTLNGRTAPLWGVIELFKSKTDGKIPADALISLWSCSYENVAYYDYLVAEMVMRLTNHLAYHQNKDRDREKKGMSPLEVRNGMAFLKAHVHFTRGGMVMSTDYDSPWYQIGRLVAICREVQRRSLDGGNTNIEQVLSVFQVNPHMALNMALSRVEPHWDKIKETPAYQELRKQFDDAVSRIDVTKVAAVSELDELGCSELLLGYYQQMASMEGDN